MVMLSSVTIGYANRVYNTVVSSGGNTTIAAIISAQAAHESGGFTSDLFRRANNCFGLKIPSKRKDPYISGNAGNGYAKYNNIEDSVKSLLNLLDYDNINWKIISSAYDYSVELKAHGYYEDSQANYFAGITNYLSQIRNFLKANTPFAAIIGVFIAIVIIFYVLK